MLLIRKFALTFVSGFLAVFVLGAPALIDLFEKQDWSNLKVAGIALLVACVGGGLRIVVALLTAFVPSDAAGGVNLVGKYRNQ